MTRYTARTSMQCVISKRSLVVTKVFFSRKEAMIVITWAQNAGKCKDLSNMINAVDSSMGDGLNASSVASKIRAWPGAAGGSGAGMGRRRRQFVILITELIALTLFATYIRVGLQRL